MILGITKPPPTTTLNLHGMSAAEYLCLVNITQQQHLDDTAIDPDKEVGDNKKDCEATDDNSEPSNLLAYVSTQSTSPGDLRKVLSSASSTVQDKRSGSAIKGISNLKRPKEIVIDGVKFCSVNVHECV